MVISTQWVRESILCAILANLTIACNNFYPQDVRESILLAGYAMLTVAPDNIDSQLDVRKTIL